MKKYFLFLTLSLTAHAGSDAWLNSGFITPEIIQSLQPELDLTAEQHSQMQAIVAEARTIAGTLEQSVREQQKALNALLKNPQSTEAQASTALTQLLDAEAPVKQHQLRVLMRLRDLLTAEQQKKALALAPRNSLKQADQTAQIRVKAARLLTAVEALGVKPTLAMSKRADEIESLIRAGDWTAAERALDQLTTESALNESTPVTPPDFTAYDPGDTDLTALKQRYLNVEAAAQSVISLKYIQQLITAREALEDAKAAEDATQVGRILTWAETMLK